MTFSDFYLFWRKFGKKSLNGEPIAIALGGSRGIGLGTFQSDWDFNVFFGNLDHIAEQRLTKDGFLFINGEKVHWYLHSLNSFDGDPNKGIPWCSAFWAKLPLMEETSFYAITEKGERYIAFLRENQEAISILSLKNVFSCCNDDPDAVFVKLKKGIYGLMKLGNHFGLSDFSDDDILKCKTDFGPYINENRVVLVDLLSKLKHYVDEYDFPFKNMNGFWERTIKEKCLM